MKLNIPEEKLFNIKQVEKILGRALTTEELTGFKTKQNSDETLSVRITTENYSLFKEIKSGHKTNYIFGLMLEAFIEKYTKEES
jgi:hypothetical protein